MVAQNTVVLEVLTGVQLSKVMEKLGLTAWGGHGKTRGGYKVKWGYNLSDLA